jgi:hypothetical protein
MFIKQIKKNNTPNGKVFLQYQLSESYRISETVRQRTVLYLGFHELLATKENRAIVAKLLESRINDEQSLSEKFENAQIPQELIRLSDEYYQKYLIKQQSKKHTEKAVNPNKEIEYEPIDLNSTKVVDCREMGAEWMSYQILERIGLREFLSHKAWSESNINNALISIISRAVASFSENKTEDWLKHNSGLTELFDKNTAPISRHHLYKSSYQLYEIKEELEEFFYDKFSNMFELKDSLFIYDLTNTYFEGKKSGSKISKFGRSKEKRSDCKLVVLAAVVNEHGFLKSSNIYEGNMSDPDTLMDLINKMQKSNKSRDKQQIIVIDAGIATEDNLSMLRREGYLYVCVSRSKPRGISVQEIENTVNISDNKGSEIKLKFLELENSPDKWLYVQSEGKRKKEDSMLEQGFQRFEEKLETVKSGISKKGGTKQSEKVWERIGRIKELNRRVNKYYDIQVEVKDGIAVSIEWSKKEAKPSDKRSGEYFLRTNYSVSSEAAVWQIYNTIREVESTFRCLKTDLNLRPVYHQKDIYTEAHLHLGLLAYQIVAPIRYMLKQKGINYSWSNIVRIMNTQKVSSVSLQGKSKKEILIRTCSRPLQEVLEIYKALKMKSMAYGNKKFVVYH